MLHYKKSYFSYNHKEVDQKWQNLWRNQSNNNKDASSQILKDQQKLYILGQFPYPSGSIHMGHVRVYTICDVLTRYYKQQGFNVINPMGWDSFGLPAENAALTRNVSPKEWTNKNIQEMKNQLLRLGFDFDWDKELATHTPEYYKFTQEIFIDLYNKGLAYKKEAQVNWDPVDQTVLANEQIDSNGNSWRSGAKVEKKMLNQWFFKIRDYAEEILNDLNNLNKWSEVVKEAQRGWIGKSQGAHVQFQLKTEGNEMPLTVFTTRPDTIFGVSFIALSHEHPIIPKLIQGSEQDKNAYDIYLQQLESLKQKGKDLKQIDLNDIDEGIKLTNVTAIHPITQEQIPVYLTSYVLNDYGTGSIMGVPFHDERDCAFAFKNNLPFIQVISADEDNEGSESEGTLVNSQNFNGLKSKEATDQIIKMLESIGKGQGTTEYRLRDWLVSRQRYWGVPIPIVYCGDCGELPVEKKDLPVLLPEINDVKILNQGQALEKLEQFIDCKCPKCGKQAKREKDTLDTFVDSSWYFLRYLDSQNQNKIFDIEKIKKWMPVDIYVGGMEHAIMHLLYARFIHKFLIDQHQIASQNDVFNPLREPFKELIVQGLVKGKTYKLKSNSKYIFPDEIQNYSQDSLEITFEKMSKSKGNGIIPEIMAQKYGVDSLRLALMFAAPPESDINFDENFLQSIKSFLDKVQRQAEQILQQSPNIKITKSDILSNYQSELIPIYTLLQDYHQKLSNSRFFHVSLARLMELNNYLLKLKRPQYNEVYILGFTYLIQALYPFTPHISSDIWEQISKYNQSLGFSSDLNNQRWEQDISEILDRIQQKIKLRVCINGKEMGIIEIPKQIQGKADDIFDYIKLNNPDSLKKIEQITSQVSINDFAKVIAVEDKPIINFIMKK